MRYNSLLLGSQTPSSQYLGVVGDGGVAIAYKTADVGEVAMAGWQRIVSSGGSWNEEEELTKVLFRSSHSTTGPRQRRARGERGWWWSLEVRDVRVTK